MVKVPNRPPTPIEPRSSAGVSGQLPAALCPSLEIEITTGTGVSLQVGDPVLAQVLDGHVRLLCHERVVALVEDEAKAGTIIECHEIGVQYKGQVARAHDDRAVILLDGHS